MDTFPPMSERELDIAHAQWDYSNTAYQNPDIRKHWSASDKAAHERTGRLLATIDALREQVDNLEDEAARLYQPGT